MAELSAERGYVFPRGLEEWADFDYVGGRGPWVSAALDGSTSSASSSTRGTRGSRARGAGRFAPRRSGAASTTGTTSRSRKRSSSSSVPRSRCRDGSPAGARLFPVRRRRRAAHHAAASAARAALPLVAPEGSAASTSACSTARSDRSTDFADTLDRERPPVVGIAVNLMTKRNALRMIATARAARREGRRRRTRSAALRGGVPRCRRRRRGRRRRRADARGVARRSCLR